MLMGLPHSGGRLVVFFQAEDGIRDLTVTGVQTCALPIFRRFHPPPCEEAVRALVEHSGKQALEVEGRETRFTRGTVECHRIGYGSRQEISCRSEERRVGKECRSRWSPYH